MVIDTAREAALARLDQLDGSELLTGTDDKPPISSNSDPKITIYSMIDGEPRSILKLDRTRVLSKTLSDKSPAFWYEGMPGEPPTYTKGTIRCFLHPEFDETDGPAEFDRSFIDDIGLAGLFCNANNPRVANVDSFRTVFDRDEHVRRKHKRTWATVQSALERKERDAEREERRADRDAMLALAGGVPPAATMATAPVAVAEAAPAPATKAAEAIPVAADTISCPDCGTAGLKGKRGVGAHKRFGHCKE